MQRTFIFSLAAAAAMFAQAAWYWPFGHDEDDPSQPVRLHRLLEEANNFIEVAEDEALNGNGDKALENYRLALAELDRVERENPERAETAEFSPLRNKRAACVAAMDSIRFAQVNDNERAVSVTDTRELQKKWNRKHGIKDPGDAVDSNADATNTVAKAEEKGKPAEPGSVAKVEEKGKPSAIAEVSDFDMRFKTALAEVRNKDYAAADLLLESLIQERPKDLNVMLLRAAAQVGLGSNYAARRTLEKAMRTNPKSYLPYYNLANLALKLGEGVETARQYYEMGRMVGGPASPALEAKFK